MMKKKKVNKKTVVKEIGDNKDSSKKKRDMEKILIENFVSLQKVMVNLSVKFDNLTHQISKLLELFEISAKALAEKDFEIEKGNKENVKIIEKIENVLEQNKTIARGLSLMHDKMPGPKSSSSQMHERSIIHSPPKLPFRPIQRTPAIGRAPEEYHKPISSNEQ